MPAGERLASLADIAALGRSARAAAESHAAEQRRADKERVGRQRASEAAIWWRTRFGVYGVEPRMLTWTGYPLPDSRASWQASESGRIHAVAHLGGPVFLTHHSRSTYGEYGTTEHTMTVVAPCVCGQVREHDIADIPDLGDVLDDIAANACAGTCTPSERTVHDPDASDF